MRDGEDGVGSELALVGGAVEFAHDGIEFALVAGVHALEFGGDDLVDVVDGLENALADVTRLVAVAQFDGLVLAGGGSAGHCGAAAGAAFEDDIGFDGRIATGVKNFARKNQFDLGHGYESFVSGRWISPSGIPVTSPVRGLRRHMTGRYQECCGRRPMNRPLYESEATRLLTAEGDEPSLVSHSPTGLGGGKKLAMWREFCMLLAAIRTWGKCPSDSGLAAWECERSHVLCGNQHARKMK